MSRRSNERDIPVDLKPFHKLFEKLCYGYGDYSSMFGNFLDITIAFFARGTMQHLHEEVWNRLNEKQRLLMNDLLVEYIMCNQRIFAEERQRKWYDFFGCYYEYLSSNGHRQGMGQFFTPDTVVEFMTQINSTDKQLEECESGKPITGLRINDPACGSGRFLIAYHVNNLGNYICGADLDYTCCRMTCLNMMLHGCDGEVIWKDSLDPVDYKAGWRINGDITLTGIPSVLPLEKEHSLIWNMDYQYLLERTANIEKREAEKQAAKRIILKPDNAGQLELF